MLQELKYEMTILQAKLELIQVQLEYIFATSPRLSESVRFHNGVFQYYNNGTWTPINTGTTPTTPTPTTPVDTNNSFDYTLPSTLS